MNVAAFFTGQLVVKEVEMNRHTPRRLLVAAALAGIIAATAGCANPDGEQTPSAGPSLTPVPTEEPWETPGSTEPLATSTVTNGYWRIYEVVRYTAGTGCGCTEFEDGPELFPAGSDAILLRLTFTPTWKPGQEGETWTIPELKLVGDFPADDGLAVEETTEGPERAEESGIAWLPEGAFPSWPATVTNEVPVSFALAYYLPVGAQRLDLTLTGHYDPVETDWPAEPSVIEVPIEVMGHG